MTTKFDSEVDKTNALAMRIPDSGAVSHLSDEGHDESHAVAHFLVELAEFSLNITQLVGKVMPFKTMRREDIEDALTDIGEEIRHLTILISTTRYYGYLTDPDA